MPVPDAGRRGGLDVRRQRQWRLSAQGIGKTVRRVVGEGIAERLAEVLNDIGGNEVVENPEAAARLQALVLHAPDGQAITLNQWQGKVRVFNFWATWCPPCRQEIPALSRIQEKLAGNGVQLVGIALDSQDSVREFSALVHIPYPLLLASPEAIEILKALGNRQGALPFTVVLDRQGQIRYAGAGSLDEERASHILAPLLAQ